MTPILNHRSVSSTGREALKVIDSGKVYEAKKKHCYILCAIFPPCVIPQNLTNKLYCKYTKKNCK
jgi:hypothetical protein